MKGVLAVCFLLYIACVKGTDPVIETPPDSGVVLKVDTAAQELLKCSLRAVTDFTVFKWKKGETELCTAVDQDAATCPITAGNTALYETKDPKFALHVKTGVKLGYNHAGSYSCEVATPDEPAKTGDITVVAENPVCGTIYLEKDKEATIQCKISYKGSTKPNIKINSDDTTVTSDGDAGSDGTNTIVGTLQITPSTNKQYTCDSTTDTITGTCKIDVKVYSKVITTKPTVKTVVVVGEEGKIPCTVDAAGDYSTLKWYHTDPQKNNLICTGTKAAPTADDGTPCIDGYSIDTPAPHDLTIIKVAAASMNTKFIGVVESAGESPAPSGDKCETTLALVKVPTCPGVWVDGKLMLICKVEFNKDGPIPKMKWFEGDTEIKDSVNGAPIDSEIDGWKVVNQTSTRDKVTPMYTCKVYQDNKELTRCTQSAASALSVKFFQSTLLSLVVVFLMNQFK